MEGLGRLHDAESVPPITTLFDTSVCSALRRRCAAAQGDLCDEFRSGRAVECLWAPSASLVYLRPVPDGSDDRFDDGFDDAAQRALNDATHHAGQLGHRHVGTEHLLLGLLADTADPAAQALRRAGATPEGARSKIIEAVGRGEPLTHPTQPAYTARARRAIERAFRFSLQRRRPMASTDDLLVGVLDVEGTAGQVLRGLAVDIASLRTDVQSLGQGDSPEETAATKEPTAGGREPCCGVCGADLERVLAHRRVASTGRDERRQLVAAYCSGCGTTFGILSR